MSALGAGMESNALMLHGYKLFKSPSFIDKENKILQRQSQNENPVLLITFYHTWSHYITRDQKATTGPQALTNNSEIQKALKICISY